jgi:hypothetical protein
MSEENLNLSQYFVSFVTVVATDQLKPEVADNLGPEEAMYIFHILQDVSDWIFLAIHSLTASR